MANIEVFSFFSNIIDPRKYNSHLLKRNDTFLFYRFIIGQTDTTVDYHCNELE